MTIQLMGPDLDVALRKIFTFALNSNLDFTFGILPGKIEIDGTPAVLSSLKSILPASITVNEV